MLLKKNVVVTKNNGKVSLCLDIPTINTTVEIETYPIHILFDN